MNTQQDTMKIDAIHERLRYLRAITRLVRSSLAAKYGIPEVTLRVWESGRAPITNKAIHKCIEIYRQEGISVTEEWVRNGTGDLPILDHTLKSFMIDTASTSGSIENNIESDYKYFQETYTNCILFKITNDQMLPSYKQGDLVIGRKNNRDIKDMHNKDAIILLDNGEVVFRRIFINTQNKINLGCLNPLSEGEIIFDAKIKSIAPIMIHYIL